MWAVGMSMSVLDMLHDGLFLQRQEVLCAPQGPPALAFSSCCHHTHRVPLPHVHVFEQHGAQGVGKGNVKQAPQPLAELGICLAEVCMHALRVPHRATVYRKATGMQGLYGYRHSLLPWVMLCHQGHAEVSLAGLVLWHPCKRGLQCEPRCRAHMEHVHPPKGLHIETAALMGLRAPCSARYLT